MVRKLTIFKSHLKFVDIVKKVSGKQSTSHKSLGDCCEIIMDKRNLLRIANCMKLVDHMP